MTDFIDRVKLTMEYEVIRSLLQGNDTLCFTTRQYVDAREIWLETQIRMAREKLGLPAIDFYDIELARKQLAALPSLVIEVDNHIWSPPLAIEIVCKSISQ